MNSYQIEKGWYVGDCLPSKSELFNDVIKVLKRHPKLRLNLAHFGFTTDAYEEAEEYEEKKVVKCYKRYYP
jgi:predicted TIM-barrel fold metal-dependent hydrolase